MKPVYLINGFLESGKTEFITYTLAQPYFQSRGKTLILLCEEGEIEYDPELLKKTNSVLELMPYCLLTLPEVRVKSAWQTLELGQE